jgi:hypothetical protein
MKKAHIHFIILLFVTPFFSGCQKVIPIKLDSGTSQLTVDAFIDDQWGTQNIRLTNTGAYFDNVPNKPVTGATVDITDNQGHTYNFVDNTNSGNYTWTPSASDTLVRLFNTYTLSVINAGEQYQATSIAYPTAPVDSVPYTLKKSIVGSPLGNGIYTASFYAKDIKGMTNFYWIKSYKNGVYYSKPIDINISQDGSFAGGGTDGLTFILPIREGIIPLTDSLFVNDSITVKIYAITPQTFFYLSEVIQQTTNGGLFATPPSNVSTNIINVTAGSTSKPVGWFNIGQVSIGGIKIK